MKQPRTSAKAIIVQNEHLLATRNADGNFSWYLLPGGGQHHGETLHEALLRECQEEIGATVRIGELKLIREYIGKTHEFAEEDGDVHSIEFMFECEVEAGYMPQNGPAVDVYQTGVAWLRIADLHQVPLYPQILKRLLANGIPGERTMYLGNVN